MEKTSQYFPHDYNARDDEKIIRLIQQLGWEGYGLYWAIVEKLYEAGGRLAADCECIAFALHTDSERISRVLRDFGLFYFLREFDECAEKEVEKFGSRSVDKRLSLRADRSKSARKSAMKRWCERNANAMRTQCDGNAINKGKERKERKERNRSPSVEGDSPEASTESPSGPPGPPLMVFQVVGKSRTWDMQREHVESLEQAFPGMDVLAEARKAKAWTEANPRNKKTATGMPQFLFRWMSRSQNGGRHAGEVRTGRGVDRIVGGAEPVPGKYAGIDDGKRA